MKIKFKGGRYTRLFFNALVVAVFGVALVGISTTLRDVAFLGGLFNLLGLVLAGIGLIGSLAAGIAVLQIMGAYLVLNPDSLVIAVNSRKQEVIPLEQVQILVWDYERILASRKGLRFDPPNPTGLRLLTHRTTVIIKGTMLASSDRAALEKYLTDKTSLKLEKPRFGPEAARVKLISEIHEFKPDAGLAILTSRSLIAYRDSRERALAFRQGKSWLALPLTEIALVERQTDKLLIKARDGLEYELTFAYVGEDAAKKNNDLLDSWFKTLKTGLR